MVEKIATAQNNLTPVEQSQPLRGITPTNEALAKQAEIKMNSTIKASATNTIGADVEKGRATTGVTRAGDEGRYLSGLKFIFLFLWVSHIFTAQLIHPMDQGLAALYFPW